MGLIDGIGDVQKPESRSTLLNVAFEQQRLAREVQVENEFDELEAAEHTPVSSSESAKHPSGTESQTDGVQPGEVGTTSRKLGIRQFARVDELSGHGFGNAPG